MSQGATAVAMSGGVDSSVAAALVARRGGSTIGFSMQLVDHLRGENERYGRCCSPEDFQDARRVADRLGFPHYILDLEEEFERHVLQPFADDYAAGRTPSPCVRCNTFMKFGTLLGRSRAVGAERVATGHYAILEYDRRRGRTLLRQARDLGKDQSYYLFDLSEAQRAAAEFPLGDLTKDEVRATAREFGLATAEKPESMDLCFVAKGERYNQFLAERGLAAGSGEGPIVDTNGEVVGTHGGIERFTVGQRRGIGVSADNPLYVIQLRPQSNEIVVGQEQALLQDRCVIERSRWVPFERPGGELRADVRIRANHGGSPARLRDLGEGRTEIRFDEPEKAIAPGQAAVAYDGDLVLGGGWIAA